MMKRFSMTVVGLITLAPAPAFAEQIASNIFLMMLMAILFLWVCIEFYIGLTKPCHGISQSLPLIKISRMIWPFFVVYSWLDLGYGWSRAAFPSWFTAFLTALSIAALLLRVWAVAHLGKSFTYDVTKPFSGRLAKTGPYRFVRHPSYLGILILGSLPGLILGSVPGFIGMLLTTLVPVILRGKAEDELLEKEFGDEFVAYKKTTSCLVPPFFSHRQSAVKVRIHSANFRLMFIIYHLSGATGSVLLSTFILSCISGNNFNMMMLALGIFMIALPLTTAPPEIVVLLDEKRILFRKRLTSNSVYFNEVRAITASADMISIANASNKEMITITQSDFKNIPLYDLSKYIGQLMSDSKNTNLTQYTAISFGRCTTAKGYL